VLHFSIIGTRSNDRLLPDLGGLVAVFIDDDEENKEKAQSDKDNIGNHFCSFFVLFYFFLFLRSNSDL